MKSKRCFEPSKNWPSLTPGFSFGGPVDRALPEAILKAGIFPRITPPLEGSDEYWMLEALRTATVGVGSTHPNPAVGCIIVDSAGNELARGATQAYPGLHAETDALNKIQNPNLLEGATLYVTLEPCTHFGKQPPCVDPIIASPIRRVVVSRDDPDFRVNGLGIIRLREAGKDVSFGPLWTETTAWNYPFFAQKHLGRPIVILKWAQTLDGQLADDQGTSQWITGQTARAYSHWLRQRYDAVLVGAGTWIKEHPQLNSRDCPIPTPYQPIPILFDPQASLMKAGSDLFERCKKGWHNQSRKWVYITREEAGKSSPSTHFDADPFCHLIRLRALGAQDQISEMISILGSPTFEKFHGRPFQSLFVEGGAKTLSRFIDAGYADLLHVFIAPSILGGKDHRVSSTRLMDQILRFDLMGSFQLGSDMVAEMVPFSIAQSLFSAPVEKNS